MIVFHIFFFFFFSTETSQCLEEALHDIQHYFLLCIYRFCFETETVVSHIREERPGKTASQTVITC